MTKSRSRNVASSQCVMVLPQVEISRSETTQLSLGHPCPDRPEGQYIVTSGLFQRFRLARPQLNALSINLGNSQTARQAAQPLSRS